MKRVLGMLGVAVTLLFCVYSALFCVFETKAIENTPEVKTVEFEPLDAQMMMDVIVRESKAENKEQDEITITEAQELMRIAMAEAEADGVEGKAMVMAVVLNRVKDKRFPNNVHDVIFQDKQFSPISDGRYFEVTPDVECHLALAEIECGNYAGIDALYFENASGSWQAKNCTYLYTVGHHRFYKN